VPTDVNPRKTQASGIEFVPVSDAQINRTGEKPILRRVDTFSRAAHRPADSSSAASSIARLCSGTITLQPVF